MIKKILIITLIGLFLLPMVLSEEAITEEDIVIAGITPDSPFYKLEVFFEDIIDVVAMEHIKIDRVRERLAETKIMIAEGKLEKAQRCIENFNRVASKVKNQTKLVEQKGLTTNLGQKISEIASDGQLTDEEKQQIRDLIEEHKERIRAEVITNIAMEKGIEFIEAEQKYEEKITTIRQKINADVEIRFEELNRSFNQNGR